MDKIYDLVGDAEVELEKLREECQLSDSLRKVDAQQQQKLEIDKLAWELHAKSEEIFEIRQLYEELQSSLHRKDLFLQQISSSSEKLQAQYNEKILKLEAENRDLVSSLDDALARIEDLEKKACASAEEIAGLKRLLSINHEKNSQVRKNASKDLKERDECILKLEEKSRISQDQLKWKNEQFSHLKEAHKKLQGQFQESKSEWQKEISSLVDEVSSLQDNLDAQIRVSESLETQLRISNNALAREESRRKVIEIQVSEYRSKLDNVFLECQGAKSEIEQLTVKKDEVIAELQILLRKKEILANEMKYKIQQLEQDNSDLVSLKDTREVQLLNNGTSSSLKKLRNKLHGLEQLHGKCSINLEKEAELNSPIEKLTGDVSHCLSELAVRNRIIRESHEELEDCQCLLEVKSEEIFALVMVLKSEFYNAYTKSYVATEKLEMGIMQLEEKNMFLDQQLQSKNAELHKAHTDMKRRSNEVADLMELLKQKDNLMEEELRRSKTKLDESIECQSRLEQQLQELENTDRENMKNSLEMVYSELADKTCEVEKCKLELQESKSEVEILKKNLKESQREHEQEITNLVVNANDKDFKFSKLQEQSSVLELGVLAKSEAAEMFNQEKDNYTRLATSLQNEIAWLKNELAERGAANGALLVANSTLGQANERLIFSIEEKDQEIQLLKKYLESLNQEFKSAMISLAEKEVMLDEALTKSAECQKTLEVEEKNRIIANLENEVDSLREQVESQEKSLLQVEETKRSEMQELRSQLEKEKRCFEGLLEELESHKQALCEHSTKGKLDRENLLSQLEAMCGQIGIFCGEDMELMDMLRKLSHVSEEDIEPVTNL